MAITDWDIFSNSPDALVTLKTNANVVYSGVSNQITSPPIRGASSLLTFNGAGDAGTKIQIQPKPAFSSGQLKGKLRTLVHVIPTAGGVKEAGLYCLSGQTNLITTGNCYLAYFTTALNNFNFIIAKSGNGIEGFGSAMALATSPTMQWAEGTTFALEFVWDATGTSAVLVLRLGSATDFSDLTNLLSYEDTTSPFLTSSGEGLFHSDVSSPMQVLWDSTSLEEITA